MEEMNLCKPVIFSSHIEYMKDGQKHMRLKFYIEGSEPGLRGTVHSESQEVTFWFLSHDKSTHTHCVYTLVCWYCNKQASFAILSGRYIEPAPQHTLMSLSLLCWECVLCFFISQNPESGKYEFRYIFVEVETYPRRTIVIEDNRWEFSGEFVNQFIDDCFTCSVAKAVKRLFLHNAKILKRLNYVCSFLIQIQLVSLYGASVIMISHS